MALLNFPPAPINGQLFPATPLPGQAQYEWLSAESTWRLLGPATTVVPGCYGDGLNVAAICVDAQGRITSAVNTPITLTGGTVTDVTAGIGLLGGVITVSGTIDLDTSYTDGLYLGLTGGVMTGDITFSGTQTFPPQDLDEVTTAGNATANGIDVGSLTAAGLNYPIADGLANDVLTTDGAGTLGWLSTLKVVTAPTASTDSGNLGEVAVSAGFLYFYDGTQWLQIAGSVF